MDQTIKIDTEFILTSKPTCCMMKRPNLTVVIIFLFALGPVTLLANIRLPAILSDNMVLQRDSVVRLWGWANPSEKILITPSWSNKTDSVTATGNARWMITIPTPAAGGPFSIRFQGQNTITLQNILVGEVWICSGQSNMEWSTLNGLKEMETELPNSTNPSIRFFNIPKTTSDHPQDDCVASWEECGPQSLRSFSAVGYYFGKKLYEKLKVPIGLINASWGGTPAEVWTPEPVVNNDETTKKAALKLNESEWWPVQPGKTYNAMIAPVTPFPIAGAIWYQGESNTLTSNSYQLLMTNMINSWRTAWQKDIAFYYVQIAPFAYGNKNVGALLREAQSNMQGYPKTGMVVITDLVDNINDIHPQNKHSVGERLAAYALAETYKQSNEPYRSPLFQAMQIVKNKAVLTFNHAANGFVVKGPKATEWYVAGQDRQFYPADVKIEKNNLVVSSPQVKVPVAVRFGFSNEAMGNIFSKDGLPVAPFRTDDWEVDTSTK
jgi:sialate O-acetylesterase